MPVLLASQQIRRQAQAGNVYDCATLLLRAGCKTLTEVVRLAYPAGRVPLKTFDCLADAWALLARARIVSDEPDAVKARIEYLRTKED